MKACVGVCCSHLVADDVDLVLHLWNPLTHDGEQLGDAGLGIHEDLQTGRVVRVEEGERCGYKETEQKSGFCLRHQISAAAPLPASAAV